MTPHERAEKISRLVESSFPPRDVPLIAAEIQAAVEERKGNPLAANPSEWFCLDCRPIAEALGKQAVLNAKAEAYEDAAKIAEYHSGPSIQCAEKIRALEIGDGK